MNNEKHSFLSLKKHHKTQLLDEVIQNEKRLGKKIVLTSGCFDIIHMGHILYLEEAKSLGDILIVAINSDISVKCLKGEQRPILDEKQRLRIIAELKSVDYSYLFDGANIANDILQISPDVFVIGEESVAEFPEEVQAAHQVDSEVYVIKRAHEFSTSEIIKRIRRDL